METIKPEQLEQMVYEASKAAFAELMAAHPEETFYTFGLWTDGLQFVTPAANTEQRLDKTVEHYRKNVDPKYDITSTRSGMRWSHGDWGFFANFGDEHFAEINQKFSELSDYVMELDEEDDDEFEALVEPLWDAILQGFKRLDDEDFFGTGDARSAITLLLVGDLSEEVVDAAAAVLNPDEVAQAYSNWDPDQEA